jgi:hypothetical protein
MLTVQKKIFSVEILEIFMENDSPYLNYFMKPVRCGPNVFTQFVDALLETKQNDIVILLLITT